ncbi:hypothetical protein EXIGLDRAFT_835378 [Exidia glandulosa HHB12029]|uniref:Uncharacterized protein n=1 Tax=Exidia glandulosa HHB12029 TaxID=1314781 RepID=A0A165ITU6_EXIGL|nr:hypothetical protein EXIGLDRAFT_835378 [Exidia glandulosa HHB12029]
MSTTPSLSSAVTTSSDPLQISPTGPPPKAVPPVPKLITDIGEIVLIVVLPVVAVAALLFWWYRRRRRRQRMRSPSTPTDDTLIRPYGVPPAADSHSPPAVEEQRGEKVERALGKDSRSALTPYTESANAAAEHHPTKGTTSPPATVPGDIDARSPDTAVVVEAAADVPRSDPVMLAALDDAVRGAGFSVVALLSSLNRVRHAGDDEATMPPMYEPDGVAASSHS